jgi:anion-transporting  ArsA/GET3 family ATPase
MGALSAELAKRKIAVCVGSGGVGKTTVAAAIALGGALAGKKTLVCTIDPARRLANALGLESLGNVESRVPEHKMREAGLAPRGALFAMMLDVKRTWDDLVARHAPDRERMERIFKNRFYQQASGTLAGSQEYMAMEKLYELHQERDYDLIVLDTPPTAHALDFLDAPNHVLDFLDNNAARFLLAPALAAGKVGLKLFNFGGSYIARTISRFTGGETLRDLAEFMLSFEGMYEGFKERAAAVKALLATSQVGFVLVASPSPLSVDEALFFNERLHAESMPVAGFVANRVTPHLLAASEAPPSAAALAAALGRDSTGDLAGRLARTLEENEVLARAEAAELSRLFAAGPAPGNVVLPRLETDVHDLAGLAKLASRL